VSPTVFSGTELVTLELGGALPAGAARGLVGDDLELEQTSGHARVDLFAFRMRGLKARGLPAPKFDYDEILWRVGVLLDGEPAWFSVACDIDRPAMRALGSLFVRYPVRASALSVERECVEAEHGAGGRLALRMEPVAGAAEARKARRMLVRSRGRLFEIPWGEGLAPTRSRVNVTFEERELADATLGLATWDVHGVLSLSRQHECGIAHRLGGWHS
jgi:hypothetical protein